MKITFIGHASLLVETAGLRILSDPWWSGPCFGAQWWIAPPANTSALDDAPLDYIYISHGHHDHYHKGTLKTLNHSAKVLLSDTMDFADTIRGLGFEVILVSADQPCDLGNGVHCRIVPTTGGDTLMTIHDGKQTLANLNDAIHPYPVELQHRYAKQLGDWYGRIDYLFMGHGTASHFPNCYEIPGKDHQQTAIKRQIWFNQVWSDLVHHMQPRLAAPFAASLAFFEDDLFALNAAIHNADRPSERFQKQHPNDDIQAIDWTHGCVIEDGLVTQPIMHSPFDEAATREQRATDIQRANFYGRVKETQVDEILGLLQTSLDYCLNHLLELQRDYRFNFRFRNCEQQILMEKQGKHIKLRTVSTTEADRLSIDIGFITRLPYLKQALTQRYGHEILFVGSGGIFDYQRREDAMQNLHREMAIVMRQHSQPVPSRWGKNSPTWGHFKFKVRGLLGMAWEDFYDLGEWVVFKDE